MFCRNCGSETNSNSGFCINCGCNLNGESIVNPYDINQSTYVNNSQVYYTIKPVFNWMYKFLQHAWKWIFVALYIGYTFEFTRYGIDPDTFRFVYEEITLLELYPIPILFGTIAVIFIHLFIEKMQYNKIEYNFWGDRVTYKDGFLNISEKELKYKFVREVSMSKNIIERIFNLGTIRIYTNASSGGGYRKHSGDGSNGIVLHCVGNVEERLAEVKSLIDTAV